MADTTRDAAVDEFRLLPVGLRYEHCTLHGEQQQQLLSSMPAFASREHLNQGICDLREWKTLEQHVRHTFNLPPTHAIQMEFFLGNSVCGIVADQTSLHGAVEQLLRLGAPRLRAAQEIVARVSLAAPPRRELPPLQLGVPPLSHGDRATLQRELAAACYPEGQAGAWNARCDALLATSPGHVYEFLCLREVFGAVCDERLLLNPVAAKCPFCSDVALTCTRLNPMNQEHLLLAHIRTAHAELNAAKVFLDRFTHVRSVDFNTPQSVLDTRFPWPDGFGAEQLALVAGSLEWRADYWQPVPPLRLHPLAIMLNEALLPRDGSAPALSRRHVLMQVPAPLKQNLTPTRTPTQVSKQPRCCAMRHAQALDALFHLLLGIKVTNWNVRLATLSSFAMELYHVGRERTYRLVRGAVHFGLGDAKQVLFPVVSASIPMLGEGEYGTVAALLPRSPYALSCVTLMLGSCPWDTPMERLDAQGSHRLRFQRTHAAQPEAPPRSGATTASRAYGRADACPGCTGRRQRAACPRASPLQAAHTAPGAAC